MSAFPMVPSRGWNAVVPNGIAFPLFVSMDGSQVNAYLSWPPQPGAVSYKAYIGIYESKMMRVQGRLLGSSLVIPNLTPGKVYYFLVIAEMYDKQTVSSQTVVNIGPLTLTVTAPEPGELLVSFPTIPDASDYQFFLGIAPANPSFYPISNIPPTSPANGPWVSLVSSDPAGITQYLIQGLAIGVTYNVSGQAVYGEIYGPVPVTSDDLLLIDGSGNHLFVDRLGDRLICDNG